VNVLDFKKGIGLWHSVQTVKSVTDFCSLHLFYFFLKSDFSTFSLSVECVEYVTCGQCSICTYEGESSLLDPESLSVQRYTHTCFLLFVSMLFGEFSHLLHV